MESYILQILSKFDSNTYVFIKNKKIELKNKNNKETHNRGICKDVIFAESDKTLYKGRICDMTFENCKELIFKEIACDIQNNISIFYTENGILGFKIIADI